MVARTGILLHLSLMLALAGSGAGSLADDGRAEAIRALRSQLERAEQAVARERLDDAAVLFSDALELAEGLGEPNLPLARAVDGLADVHRLRGDAAGAEKLYRRSMEMWPPLLGDSQPRLAVTLHNLGVVCLAQGRREDAEPFLERALAIWERTLGSESPHAANTRRALR